MIWTNKLPDKPGWWWVRERATEGDWSESMAVYFFLRGGELMSDTQYGWFSVSELLEYIHEGHTVEFSSEPIPEPD